MSGVDVLNPDRLGPVDVAAVAAISPRTPALSLSPSPLEPPACQC